MAGQIRIILTTLLIFVFVPVTAIAGPCDAYFRFDNSLVDDGENGYDGEMIGPDNSIAKATYTEGKFGQALHLDGTGAMRALIDLHWDSCPQVTFSAWIKVSRDVSSPSPVLFSSGQGSGPGMYFSSDSLILNGTENGIYQPNVVRPGSWMFVAGVYNYEEDIYELYYGGRRPKPGKLSLHRGEPENAFWIGTENDAWGVFASGVAVDELRITGAALETPELMALRTSAATTGTSSANNYEAGEPPASGSGQVACDLQSRCPSGNYCAVDNICYSNSQLPKGYAAAAPTGSSVRPGLDDSNQIPSPEDLFPGMGGDGTTSDSDGSSSQPDFMNPRSGPADDLAPDVSAGQVMAGRWIHSVDALPGISGGNVAHTTLNLFGRDNGLSGTVSTVVGEINDEPLTNISKLGTTVSLSSARYGSWSGQVSESGGSMFLHSTVSGTSPRRFVKQSETAPPDNPEPEREPEVTAEPTNSHVRPGPTGARLYSTVSGIVGDRSESVDLVNGFIRQIRWTEVSDRPCELEVSGWRPSTKPAGYEEATKSRTFGSGCSPSVGLGTSSLENDVGLDRTLAGIGRIQVCNNINNNMRLKGVRIWGDAILDDGSTTYIPNGDEVELPNCEAWQSDVLCPDRSFATGVLVFIRAAGGAREQITGLQLICRAIVAPGNVN